MQLRALAFGIALSVVTLAACGDNIHPGDEPQTPARIVTRVTPDPVTAGDTLTATCIVYDADDHEIADVSPTFTISPADPNTAITDLTAVVTKAGHYAGQCALGDLFGNNAGFDVVHALPAALMIDKQPNQQVYAIGATVTITHAVADRYGNPIDDAVLVDTSTLGNGAGPISNVNANAFAYGSEGSYHVHSQVMPPTDGGTDVSANLDLIVNQNGPAIACGAPVDGSMLNMAPGTAVAFTGTATDANGTMSVTVNGAPATVDAAGAFSASVTTRFGINFIDVVATDEYGVTTAKVCTFLVANQWAPESSTYADTLALRLGQSAIDDNNRNNGINSLADLLYTVANSSGLHSTLDSALLAANPIKPEGCDYSVLGLCIYRSGIDYVSSSLPGPNTDNLTLVSAGLAMSETVNQPAIKLHLYGTLDTTGWVYISYITITATFDLSLSAGKPHMAIRPGTVTTSVGSVSTDFGGVTAGSSTTSSCRSPRARCATRSRTQVTNYVSNNFNAVLDGVVSNLDISSLSASFAVPRLDSGSLTLSFAPAFTSLGTTSSRALFGIGTKLTAPVGQTYPSLGVAIPTGSVLDRSEPARPIDRDRGARRHPRPGAARDVARQLLPRDRRSGAVHRRHAGAGHAVGRRAVAAGRELRQRRGQPRPRRRRSRARYRPADRDDRRHSRAHGRRAQRQRAELLRHRARRGSPVERHDLADPDAAGSDADGHPGARAEPDRHVAQQRAAVAADSELHVAGVARAVRPTGRIAARHHLARRSR